MRPSRTPRRGVVLIVILGLLAVLALIGVAFTILAGEEESAAKNYHATYAIPRADIAPELLFPEIVGQMIGDTRNPLSVLQGHSLLRDMYGNNNDREDRLGRPTPNGQVDPQEYYLRAFDGSGNKGYDDLPGTADDVSINYVYNNLVPEQADAANNKLGGGLDEPYDYPDHQNVFLAAVTWTNSGGSWTPVVLAPSYHRPGILPAGNAAWTAAVDDRLGQPPSGHQLILRPRRVDHPFFDASDPDNDGVPNYLDVDNDGDGVPDSVWLDFGFQVQQTRDGRKFKPLVAILCIDADGKLNMNVHGNLTFDKINAAGTWIFPGLGDNLPDSHADVAGSAQITAAGSSFLALGSGLSPGEISLQNVFSPYSIFYSSLYQRYSPREYQWLLQGRNMSPSLVPGRYGEHALLRNALPPSFLPQVPPRAGFTGADNDWPPAPYTGPATRGDRLEGTAYPTGNYRTPVDFDGDAASHLDNQGRHRYGPWLVSFLGSGGPTAGWPTNWGETDTSKEENINESDEISLSSTAGSDQPFTSEDLEILLRYHEFNGYSLAGADARPGRAGVDDDVNGTMDDMSELGWPRSDDVPLTRIAQLAASLFDQPTVADASVARRRRLMLSTQSWDLARYSLFPLIKGNVNPSPPPATSVADTAPLYSHLTFSGNGRFNTSRMGPGFVSGTGQLAAGLTWTGGPDDRPGVAGVDDNGSNGIDDVAEYGTPGSDDVALPDSLVRGYRIDLNRTLVAPASQNQPYWATTSVTSAQDPRALARDIYILMRAIRPTSNVNAIRQMAQFAVNVVDFRDPDDFMTGFEYDTNLQDGWNVDGNLSTTSEPSRDVVWGVEKPRVVINETYAYEQPMAPNQIDLWFELYNTGLASTDDYMDLNGNGTKEANEPSLSQVDLAPLDANNQRQPAYQVVLADRNPDPQTGEPSSTTKKLVFEPLPGGAAATTRTIDGGQLLLVGPVNPPYSQDPALLTTYPVDFDTLSGAFNLGPGDRTDDWRLYLRRTAHPGYPPDDLGADGTANTGDETNPYITTDALDVAVFDKDEVSPPMMGDPPVHFSYERVETFSVFAVPHTEEVTDPHTLKRTNEQAQSPATALTFQDRPLVSPLELLNVPGVRPQWVTSAFPAAPEPAKPRPVPKGKGKGKGLARNLSRPKVQVTSPYDPQTAEDTAGTPFVTGEPRPTDKPYVKYGEDYLYGHLMNFFREVTPAAAEPTPGYHRLLEFVEVPSRFNGTRNPFTRPSSDSRLDRVPGKININTIYEPEILLALLNNHPAALVDQTGNALTNDASASAIWQRFIESRDGASAAQNGRLTSIGTREAQPFLSLSAGLTTDIPDSSGSNGFKNPSIHSTLLRGVNKQSGASSLLLPLFQDDRNVSPPGITVNANSLQGFPYYLEQPLHRLGNLATTRSHVFTVWMTVGFFEVASEPEANSVDDDADGRVDEPDELMPRLGREIGIDTGQNVRHRAFFVIDRSRAKGYAGPPKNSNELQDMLNELVIYSRIIE